MKIVVDEIPEEGIRCIFGEMDYTDKPYNSPAITCRVDGYLCDLEHECCCEKLITFEEITKGNNA